MVAEPDFCWIRFGSVDLAFSDVVTVNTQGGPQLVCIQRALVEDLGMK